MLNLKRFTMSFVVLLVAVLGVSVFAAPDAAGGGFGGMGGGFGGMGGEFDPSMFDPAAMQERRMTSLQQQLEIPDEEWAVIKPLLSKVMELQQASGTGGMGGMMGGFGGGMMGGGMGGGFGGMGGMGGQQPAAEVKLTPVQKATQELQETLAKEAPTTAEIKAKLAALIGAREKAKAELEAAQKSLREVLTLKLEAQLVMMGYL